MGRYTYTEGEKELNKVFKYNEQLAQQIGSEVEEINQQTNDLISESEELLREIGYGELLTKLNPQHLDRSQTITIMPTTSSWEELLAEANEVVDTDIELEDLLSQEEFQVAFDNLQRINTEFSKLTNLNKTDISFLVLAIALQTLRWILLPELGHRVNINERLSDKDGDKLVKEKKKAFCEKHDDWSSSKPNQGKRLRVKKSWKEIIYSGVPYDVTAGSPAQNINMGGKYHRYKTLGHDPILGWFFGTANILTNTITLNDFRSYRVSNNKFTNEMISLPTLFMESYLSVKDDIHLLPAAVFRQALHFESDKYTKLGLPVPLLEVFSEEWAGKLYKSNYDSLCLMQDISIIGESAALAMFINLIITLTHQLFYDSTISRELYELKTRKILLYSNIMASSSNVISVTICQNPKKLDIGGLIVTISRLFSDVRFITKVKDEFIKNAIDDNLKEQLADLDNLFINVFNK